MHCTVYTCSSDSAYVFLFLGAGFVEPFDGRFLLGGFFSGLAEDDEGFQSKISSLSSFARAFINEIESSACDLKELSEGG